MTMYGSSPASAGANPILRAPLHLDVFRCSALGQVIAAHRDQRRISREAFAELLGVTVGEVEQLELGQLEGLSIPVAWTVADLLGVDLAELLHEARWRTQELAAERWTTEAETRRVAC